VRWRHEPPANHGIGCGVARYKGTGGWCAVVACASVESRIRVLDLFISADVGTVVSPDGVRSQIEGGAVQATSWTLAEQVRFDESGVVSGDWDQYPILRFSDVPRVQVTLMDRPGEPAHGAGEMAQGPTAAAIANALSNALGTRLRCLPFSFERVVQEISG
jgi:CO/xanthine dehydrogenase Mo-binding subunit